jgi:hypothetical protein
MRELSKDLEKSQLFVDIATSALVENQCLTSTPPFAGWIWCLYCHSPIEPWSGHVDHIECCDDCYELRKEIEK